LALWHGNLSTEITKDVRPVLFYETIESLVVILVYVATQRELGRDWKWIGKRDVRREGREGRGQEGSKPLWFRSLPSSFQSYLTVGQPSHIVNDLERNSDTSAWHALNMIQEWPVLNAWLPAIQTYSHCIPDQPPSTN
jgi:hypothetical protein